MSIALYPRSARALIPVLLLLLLAGAGTLMLPTVAMAAPYADSVRETEQDSLSNFVKTVIAAGNQDRLMTEESYRANKINLRQRQIESELLLAAQEAKSFLSRGANLKATPKQLARINRSFDMVKDGVLVNKGTAQTDRNLRISGVILMQLREDLADLKMANDHYVRGLAGYRIQFDSLLSDPAVYSFPRDSLQLTRYLQRLTVMAKQGNEIDNVINEELEQSQVMQNEIDLLLFQLNGAADQIERYRNELSRINVRREFANIWEPAAYSRPFSEIIRFSSAKEQMAMSFYVYENLGRILMLFVLVGLVWHWLKTIRKRSRTLSGQDPTELVLIVLRKPFASSVIMVCSIYQFVFINAPFFFSYAIWAVQTICLLVLLHRFILPFWFTFWLGVAVFFLAAGAGNFILQASREERWGMVLCSLAGIFFGCFYLLSRKEIARLKERLILYFIRFMVVMEAASLLFNIFGRYNLGKVLFVTGYIGMVSAILLVWTVRLINEVLAAASHAYAHGESRSSLINYKRVGQKLPFILNVALVCGWAIIVGRNFYFFRKVAVPLQDFLREKRTVGDYSFAISGILLFAVIVLSALVLSRIVSFFADDANAEHASEHTAGKAATGSWILLLRIFIISTGLFLAFAASGLPLDKITIVLGALSVGIGLGLQGLVSNLVSGLIIAFERPVNVGDLVEINGKSGTMKSIGFRSSIVTLSNGASLVVPNSDLLSAHVTNWSLSHNRKKIEIPVPVAFGSDVEQVAGLLVNIAESNPDVSTSPRPVALALDFGASSIDFKLIVWVKHPQESGIITHELITAIDKQFRAHGIAIPYPQQEIRLKP